MNTLIETKTNTILHGLKQTLSICRNKLIISLHHICANIVMHLKSAQNEGKYSPNIIAITSIVLSTIHI